MFSSKLVSGLWVTLGFLFVLTTKAFLQIAHCLPICLPGLVQMVVDRLYGRRRIEQAPMKLFLKPLLAQYLPCSPSRNQSHGDYGKNHGSNLFVALFWNHFP